MKRVNVEEYRKTSISVTAQNNLASKIQLKKCTVVLSRSETETIMRTLENNKSEGEN